MIMHTGSALQINESESFVMMWQGNQFISSAAPIKSSDQLKRCTKQCLKHSECPCCLIIGQRVVKSRYAGSQNRLWNWFSAFGDRSQCTNFRLHKTISPRFAVPYHESEATIYEWIFCKKGQRICYTNLFQRWTSLTNWVCQFQAGVTSKKSINDTLGDGMRIDPRAWFPVCWFHKILHCHRNGQ